MVFGLSHNLQNNVFYRMWVIFIPQKDAVIEVDEELVKCASHSKRFFWLKSEIYLHLERMVKGESNKKS